MTTLILIRHGESSANRDRIFAGNYDAELAELGIVQAKATAKYIKENYKIDKLYSSNLKRAYATAKEIGEELGLEIIVNPKVREISAGKWEGIKFDEIGALYPEDFALWRENIGASRCTDGESVYELGQRIMAALTEIAENDDGKTVAIATHATPIRVSQCIIEYGSLDKMTDVPWVSNASLTIYRYDQGKWNIEAVSIDSHLEGYKTLLPANV